MHSIKTWVARSFFDRRKGIEKMAAKSLGKTKIIITVSSMFLFEPSVLKTFKRVFQVCSKKLSSH